MACRLIARQTSKQPTLKVAGCPKGVLSIQRPSLVYMTGVLAKEITPGDCHPELFRSHLYHQGGWGKGAMTVEEADLLYGLVKIVKPALILETGTENGYSAAVMAKACDENGVGGVFTVELHKEQCLEAVKNINESGVLSCACLHRESMEYIENTKLIFDMALLDTAIGMRSMELRALMPKLSPGAIVVVHDTSPNHPMRGDCDIQAELRAFGWPMINLPSPRGMTILQKP